MSRLALPAAAMLTTIILSCGFAGAAAAGAAPDAPSAAEGKAPPGRDAAPHREAGGDRVERDRFVAQSRHELNDVRNGIRDLKNRLHAAGAEGRQTFRDDLRELEHGLKDAQKHLSGLPSATASVWRKARDEVSAELHRLREKLDSVKGRTS